VQKIKAGDWVRVNGQDAKVISIINSSRTLNLDRPLSECRIGGGYKDWCHVDQISHHYTVEGDDFPIVPGEWYECHDGEQWYCVGESPFLAGMIYSNPAIPLVAMEKHQIKVMWRGE
jgi:hypothetical protein